MACYVSNRIFLRAFTKKTSYELRFGKLPKVSYFWVFGCKCFILKHGNLDKFESRSSDGIFLGYSLHSRAYRVLNLETNRVVETVEVTFDETMPCSSSVFECAGKEEMGESIFVEEQNDEPWGVTNTPPLAAPIDPATSTSAHGPVLTSSTTWGPMEQLP